MNSQFLVDLPSEIFERGIACKITRMGKVEPKVHFHRGGPFTEHYDTIGHDQCFVDIMGDEQNGFLYEFMHVDDFFAHLQSGQEVEPSERLVHEKDFRVHDKGASQLCSALHAA